MRSPSGNKDKADKVSGKSSNLADIADAAGVSVSTVSRALSGTGGVSEATTRRIQDMAAGLSYQSRAKAGQAFQLHCLVPMALFESDPAGFYRETIQAISNAADTLGAPFAVSFLEEGQDGLQRISELAESELPIGFLLVSIDDPKIHAAAADAGAAVLVNVAVPSATCDVVAPANRAGGYFATRHLLDLGHKRIAQITWTKRATIRERLAGYRQALEEADTSDFDPALVFDLDAMTPQEGANAARAALSDPKCDVTAFFCANDMVAVGVISAIENAGFSVPQDFSVISFDNTNITARNSPALTTMSIDLAEVGRESVRTIKERILNPERSVVFTQIGCRLVIRDTTRDINASNDNYGGYLVDQKENLKELREE